MADVLPYIPVIMVNVGLLTASVDAKSFCQSPASERFFQHQGLRLMYKSGQASPLFPSFFAKGKRLRRRICFYDHMLSSPLFLPIILTQTKGNTTAERNRFSLCFSLLFLSVFAILCIRVSRPQNVPLLFFRPGKRGKTRSALLSA